MAPKKKTRKSRSAASSQRSWLAISDEHRRTMFRVVSRSLVLVAVLAAGVVVTVELEARVRLDLLSGSVPSVVFVDLPEPLAPLAKPELLSAVTDLVSRNWLDDHLCQTMAAGLSSSGWLSHVNYVRRTGDARFEISGAYRSPVAMVQRGNDFYLADAEGVRLPGVYLFDPRWKVIQGVVEPVPEPGSRWGDPGLVAGLTVIDVLAGESFGDQITGVLVDNFGGRVDRTGPHIVLATDRAGGRIYWGSAPGQELAENSAGQKLAILRENYRRTGRADGNHPVIDISTFPDRFIVPG